MAGSIEERIALGGEDTVTAVELAPSLAGRLHEWITTVDHKRLGLMYIGGGLFYFVVAGLQASTIRL